MSWCAYPVLIHFTVLGSAVVRHRPFRNMHSVHDRIRDVPCSNLDQWVFFFFFAHRGVSLVRKLSGEYLKAGQDNTVTFMAWLYKGFGLVTRFIELFALQGVTAHHKSLLHVYASSVQSLPTSRFSTADDPELSSVSATATPVSLLRTLYKPIQHTPI